MRRHRPGALITYSEQGCRFKFRVVGIVIHNGRALFQRAVDDDFWAMPGGRVEMGETTSEAVRREMLEETGVTVGIERLVWVVENYYDYNDEACHELAFYYLVRLPDGCNHLGMDSFDGCDGDVRLEFRWLPLDRLADEPVWPLFLRSSLVDLPAKTTHVVHVDPGSVEHGEQAGT